MTFWVRDSGQQWYINAMIFSILVMIQWHIIIRKIELWWILDIMWIKLHLDITFVGHWCGNMIWISFCPLLVRELFYPFIGLILPIYWVLKSLLVRVWSYEIWSLVDLLLEINATMQQTPKLQLSSTTSNSILSEDYNRSKDPLVKAVPNNDVEEDIQNCQISYTTIVVLLFLNYIWF